jgi:membrane fusion protein, copper/silver efflux system
MTTPHLDPPASGANPPPGVRIMSVVRWTIVGLAAIVAAVSILSYSCQRIGAGSGAGTEQHYYCPMHPSVVRDHPGECPICSMTLVRKEAGKVIPAATLGPATTATTTTAAVPGPDTTVPGLRAIDLSPERIQLIGMRTAPVKREQSTGELRTVGFVAPNERGFAQINTRFGGWIEKLMVSETGTRVRRGQVLATIYSPEVLKAQQELLVALQWSASAPALAATGKAGAISGAIAHEHDIATSFDQNARHRLELLGISPAEIDEVVRTGKAAQAIAIRSPVEGFVVGKNAVAGLAVQPGTVLFEVADLGTVWVTADIYQLDVSRVRVGQKARFEPTSFPGETHVGKVSFVYPMLDPLNRTLRVRLDFKNRFDKTGPRLRPGMYGTVHLDLPSVTGLMVPPEAVVDTGEMNYVFIAREGGHFEPRLVKVGARARDRVEILSGVSEGEVVVTTGNFLIDSESRLRAAIEGQSATQTPSGGGAAPYAGACATDFDAQKYPDKFRACRACEIQHRGMGSMEDDCKKTIPQPWR